MIITDRYDKDSDMPPTPLQTDIYYRGYRLSSTEDTTHIYSGVEHIMTVTNLTKGRCRTTTDKAKDLVDGWLNAR